MPELYRLHSAPPPPPPRRGVLVTARPAGWQALGVSAATAVAALVPVLAPAAPALYALCAVRLERVSLGNRGA
ncbi:hypothetical protein ACFVZR_38230 [Streptomyces sp. NPDC058316]|uniref:hypothetical protein n=1 Tax=Streptomyces sp. NPDC058316 TaxID=3346442 RepID=UPI0036E19BD1